MAFLYARYFLGGAFSDDVADFVAAFRAIS